MFWNARKLRFITALLAIGAFVSGGWVSAVPAACQVRSAGSQLPARMTCPVASTECGCCPVATVQVCCCQGDTQSPAPAPIPPDDGARGAKWFSTAWFFAVTGEGTNGHPSRIGYGDDADSFFAADRSIQSLLCTWRL